MENHPRKPLIFIVYQNFEYTLAAALQTLLETWGYKAFQCRQDERDGEAFRKELRENIRTSDLVLFLLSREFRWSPYCQAEAGTAMALEKPCIPILIPPATHKEISEEIAPVLDGLQCISATDPEFISLLQARIAERLAKSNESLKGLVSRLQQLQETELSGLAIHDVHKERQSQSGVESAIKSIEKKYRLSQPKKTISSIWPSLSDPDCRASVIGNIENSLKSSSKKVNLTVLGVSLKYSLDLISTALEELHFESDGSALPRKTLLISLVHMDDQSHILHALGDVKDIKAIRTSFGASWPETKSKWKTYCGESIDWAEPVLYRIDYIPPRVGILLETGDQSILYAGRCAFKQVGLGLPIFNLDVGENEYLFYRKDKSTKAEDPNYKAVEEFRASFNAYKEIQYNSGVMPIWESDSWIGELRECIDDLKGPAEVTFISGTATKFEKLIIKALEKGATVHTYVCDPGTKPKQARDLHERLRRQKGKLADAVRQHRYQHPATFRAVVIKDTVIGLQTYVKADGSKGAVGRGPTPDSEPALKIPLCLIVKPCFENFEELQKQILSFAKDDPLAGEVLAFE